MLCSRNLVRELGRELRREGWEGKLTRRLGRCLSVVVMDVSMLSSRMGKRRDEGCGMGFGGGTCIARTMLAFSF